MSSPWQRFRDWAATLLRRHAPEFVQQLQSTTQQVDGAVVEYERRLKRLTRLEAEAESILSELCHQIRVHRQAAAKTRGRRLPDGQADAVVTDRAPLEKTEEDLAALFGDALSYW